MFREGQIIGLYTLIKRIGRGGFGEVWLAERRAKFVTTKVAVKLPLDEQVDHEAIKQEAVLWEQASGHPNIVPIIDADEYEGQIVIVSEYAPDGSLEELLKKEGALPTKKAIELAMGILSGLEFLHSKKIIHRDIKPANILLQGETPRLADFGISRVMKTTSVSVHMSGTPFYMSPEAFDRKRNVQTDIWSVGVILYQMLKGRLPFPYDEMTDLLGAIIMGQPEPLPDSVPLHLQEIVFKALAKKPEERYFSAREMRYELADFLIRVSQSNIQPTIKVEKPAERTEEKTEILPTPPVVETPLADSVNSLTEPSLPISFLGKTQPKLTTENVGFVANTEDQQLAETQPFDKFLELPKIESPKSNPNSLYLKLLTPFAILILLAVSGIYFLINNQTSRTDTSASPTTNQNTTATPNNSNLSSGSIAPGTLVSNSLGMKFAYIAAGTFQMGDSDDGPIHTVTLSRGFYLGRTEVTQAQWVAVMGSNPSYFKNCDNCPVEQVSWEEVQEFIRKLNLKGEGVYRLPTEAEWEYAARAGTMGDYAGNIDSMAWYSLNAGDKTHPVATKQPNAWGLYDMHGNVWEWVQDWKGEYPSGSVSNQSGATSGSNRVYRGGSWVNGAGFARSAFRDSSAPSFRSFILGFRVVRN